MIKAILMDVDGTLTDGKKYYSSKGNVSKSFSVRDGEGIYLAQKRGILCGIVTADDWDAIYHRADEIGIDKRDIFITYLKDHAVRVFCNNHGIKLSEVCYIGDDIPDIGALELAGFAACPGDAYRTVVDICMDKANDSGHGYVSNYCGGEGAVREIIEYIIRDYNS